MLAERLLVGLAAASAIVYALTPYVIGVADRFDFYDKPVGYKGHIRPTPYLGGAAVMTGFVVALLLAAGDWHKTLPLAGGVAVLWAVGTIDDRRTVSPALRVAVEIGLAVVLWAVGLGWDLHMGSALDLTMTCVWVLGVVNAFNLFDNMDGAASMMALVVAAGAALVGVVHGDVWLAVGAASLGGACLGFLPRNLTLPARIFLGDGGSMPLGFAAAVLVLAAAGTATAAWQSVLVALLLVGIPALDTSLVIVSRRRRGVSVLTGGRDHLTHRTRSFLPSARAVALALGAVQAAVSVVAVLASQGGASLVVLSAVLYVVAAAAAIVVLDKQRVEEFGLTAEQDAEGSSSPGTARLAFAALAVLGLGAGISPFFFAYYETGVWVPLGLGIVVAGAVAVVARPVRITGPTVLALAGLLGLGVWSLLSTVWAESIESAIVSGNRWLVYGALLVLLLILLRSNRRAAVLMATAGLGVAVVALSVLVRLLGDDPATLFLNGRLNSPLGYINGEGCLFVMGLWLAMAAAESRRAALAGPAAGMATLMASLALLSQSRGTAVAILGSLAVVVLFVPGRPRRIYGLLCVSAGVAAAAPELLRVYRHTVGGAVPIDIAHAAARAALVAALVVGGVWALATWAWERYRVHGAAAARARRVGSWLLVLPVVLALLVSVASAHRIERTARNQWHAFTHLTGPSAAGSSAASSYSRLLSGGGNRYDYWRVAWSVFGDHPVLGVGAGNYPRSYYQQRAISEDIDQPHSIELQALSELGLVGGLLLVLFVAGIAWGILRARRVSGRATLPRALMVGGVGVATAWLAQTSVDWMHLLPGLTAIALAGIAALVGPLGRPGRGHGPATSPVRRTGLRASFESRRALALGASAVVVTLAVAGASLSRQGLADLYRSRAQNELQVNPSAALVDADRSLGFDSDAVQTYYVKAAALAHFDQGSAAELTLKRALAREPENFVTWTLLGDVATREGQSALALHDYRYAHRLNPRDATLLSLSAVARVPRKE